MPETTIEKIRCVIEELFIRLMAQEEIHIYSMMMEVSIFRKITENSFIQEPSYCQIWSTPNSSKSKSNPTSTPSQSNTMTMVLDVILMSKLPTVVSIQ